MTINDKTRAILYCEQSYDHELAVLCSKYAEDEELRRHISHAVATESSRGWRLSKTKRGHKISLAVALGMARWASMQEQSQPFG